MRKNNNTQLNCDGRNSLLELHKSGILGQLLCANNIYICLQYSDAMPHNLLFLITNNCCQKAHFPSISTSAEGVFIRRDSNSLITTLPIIILEQVKNLVFP